MSKRESISRYFIIIKKLRRFSATTQEIMNELELESEIQSYNFRVSKRTLQRDMEDIRSIFNIDIQYDFSRGVYSINYDDQNEMQERIFEAFDTFNALNISNRLSQNIHFEKRKPQGTENLYGLLHAIKHKVQTTFTHQNYWENKITKRRVEPYALKEFRSRWYLLANDLKDDRIKSFALDRITNLEILRSPFQTIKNFDVKEHYKYCFGIVSPNGTKPEKIVLSFDPIEGKYIKSLPLHQSQQILVDNAEELKVSLYIVITHDFIMEILSHGEKAKVIEPKHFAANMKSSYQKAANQY